MAPGYITASLLVLALCGVAHADDDGFSMWGWPSFGKTGVCTHGQYLLIVRQIFLRKLRVDMEVEATVMREVEGEATGATTTSTIRMDMDTIITTRIRMDTTNTNNTVEMG
ncbi:hypothetical protein ElyMa_005662500 [Elysia marginata]|uniref:Uncharacterized protein n=1 Tax=Elysia marginata TaxID=1093978 RepID=A0AAV4FEM6_9GAST|nr:hypothetical protein ElyMa_005662500 [Elysia marginata]